jgi:hypothetical protein
MACSIGVSGGSRSCAHTVVVQTATSNPANTKRQRMLPILQGVQTGGKTNAAGPPTTISGD